MINNCILMQKILNIFLSKETLKKKHQLHGKYDSILTVLLLLLSTNERSEGSHPKIVGHSLSICAASSMKECTTTLCHRVEP